MREHAVSAPVHTADPIRGAGEAVSSAAESVKHGATELQAKFSEALPATGHFLGRLIYNTSYVLSYGVVFPVMLVVRVVPKDNVLVHGLVDGALAARDRVAEWGDDTMVEDVHGPETHDSLASENGSAHHTDESAHADYHRPKAKRSATRKTSRSPRKKS